MIYVLALLVALLCPVAGSAAPAYTQTQLCQILQPCEPPAKYASGPFLLPPVIREVSLKEIQAICGHGYRAFLGERDGPGIMGCATFEENACIVLVPKDVKAAVPELYDVVLRHELAHCRGWVHADYTG